MSYKDAKKAAEEAVEAGDTVNAVAAYKNAARLAAKSGTKEIQAWQLNNAAYNSLIKKFKSGVDYDTKLAELSAMEPGKEKIAFQAGLAAEWAAQTALLSEAKTLLNEAAGLCPAPEKEKAAEGEEAKEEAAADSGPAAKIQSNLDYITWVEEFIQNNKAE
ncbi:MAG TPA: hypothetical protein ENN55_04910 [Firmicutes bacterium]|nr:hypothetical protein [Bacillota bacterium]